MSDALSDGRTAVDAIYTPRQRESELDIEGAKPGPAFEPEPELPTRRAATQDEQESSSLVGRVGATQLSQTLDDELALAASSSTNIDEVTSEPPPQKAQPQGVFFAWLRGWVPDRPAMAARNGHRFRRVRQSDDDSENRHWRPCTGGACAHFLSGCAAIALLTTLATTVLTSDVTAAGSRGFFEAVDECGVRAGDNTECIDCAGIYLPRTGAYCAPPGQVTFVMEDAQRLPSGVLTCSPGLRLQFAEPGPNRVDLCGTCDDNPNNDCVPNCRGQRNGEGYPPGPGLLPGEPDPLLDACGICGGHGDECLDCRGVPNGASKVDHCGVCDDNSTNDCTRDCLGVWGLAAGAPDPHSDVCGVCGGDNSTCIDCLGVPGGLASTDLCGVCDSNPHNDCGIDCTGALTSNPTLVPDKCGVCGGNGSTCEDCAGNSLPMQCSGHNLAPTRGPGGMWQCPHASQVLFARAASATVDKCGVCDADPNTDCAMDCAGVWGGGLHLRSCVMPDGSPFEVCGMRCVEEGGIDAPPTLAGSVTG